jgi:hypothetical protein
MRWLKIIPAVIAIIVFSLGVSSAQQSLLLFRFTKPEILQPAHKAIVSDFNIIGYHEINIRLKPPARVLPEFDEIGRMQSLANSSV